MDYDYECAFTFNRDVQGHPLKRSILVQFYDGGSDIRTDHPVFGEADAGSDEAELYMGIVPLRKELLGRDVQGTVYRKDGRDHEQFFNAGVAVEMEALKVRELIGTSLYKELVKAVHEGTVIAHIQVRANRFAYQLPFPAGHAEATGSTFSGGCLSYFVRHATEEIFTIPAVAYDVVQSAGEFEHTCLKRHNDTFQ